MEYLLVGPPGAARSLLEASGGLRSKGEGVPFGCASWDLLEVWADSWNLLGPSRSLWGALNQREYPLSEPLGASKYLLEDFEQL